MSTLVLPPDARRLAERRLGLKPDTPERVASSLSAEAASRIRGKLVKAFRRQLARNYPEVFPNPPSVPLKVGIDRDLRARHPEVSLRTLRIVLRRHVSSPEYLKLLVAGAARIDLDGNPAGIVSADEAANAAERLRPLASRGAQ